MRVLDLCSGLGGWSEPWLENGHEVLRIDNNPKFKAVPNTRIADVFDFEPAASFDIVLASPPCEGLSRGRKIGLDDRDRVTLYLAVANRVKKLCRVATRYWVIENPKGLLRKFWGPPLTTVYYCRYGETYAKPTDLWSNDPRIASLGIPCPHASHPGKHPRHSDLCLKSRAERARIPRPLAEAVFGLWGDL